MKPQVKCFKRTFILLRRRLPPAEGRGSKEGEDAVLYAIRSCHCGGVGGGREMNHCVQNGHAHFVDTDDITTVDI